MKRGEYKCLSLAEKQLICERLNKKFKMNVHPGSLPFVQTDKVLSALGGSFQWDLVPLGYLLHKIQDACDECGREMDIHRFRIADSVMCHKCWKKRRPKSRKRKAKMR